MNATITRGRRILAVLATTSTLLLPAVGASAAPAEQANDRAAEAHAANEERAEARAERETPEPRSSQRDDEVTEDNDSVDNDGEVRPNTPDVNGDADNQHPSGKDKSAEAGNSGNQGNAQHDPDDDGNGPDRSNGGVDQPGGQGGEDLDDQDGNNGCGNDDDFEDDNEGLCGGNPDRGPKDDTVDEDEDTTVVENEDANTTVVENEDGDTTVVENEDETVAVSPVTTTTPLFEVDEGVLSEVVTRGDTADVSTEVTEEDGEVAAAGTAAIVSATLDADTIGAADDGALPRTGAGLAGLAAVGLSALVGGTALSRRRS